MAPNEDSALKRESKSPCPEPALGTQASSPTRMETASKPKALPLHARLSIVHELFGEKGAFPAISCPSRADMTAGWTRPRPLMRDSTDASAPARAGIGATSTRSSPGSHFPTPETSKQIRPDCCHKWWWYTSHTLTCCFPNSFLTALGLLSVPVRQAWREKVSLCIIILLSCCLVVLLTFFLRDIICPTGGYEDLMPIFNQSYRWPRPKQLFGGNFIINGFLYDFDTVFLALGGYHFGFNDDWRGTDITKLFRPNVDKCAKWFPGPYNCTLDPPHGGKPIPFPGVPCPDPTVISSLTPRGKLYMDWSEIEKTHAPPHAITVIQGAIVNVSRYYNEDKGAFFDTIPNDGFIHPILRNVRGRDGSRDFTRSKDLIEQADCLRQRYQIGWVDEVTLGCFLAQVVFVLVIVVVGFLILLRFIMSLWFHWSISPYLTRKSSKRLGNRRIVKKHSDEMLVLMLVTCYSENEESLKRSLESLANSSYPTNRKLLVICCDGIVTGAGNDKSTPETVLNFVHLERSLGNVVPKNYLAIGLGARQHSMAKVYGGWFFSDKGERVPTIVIVKVGSPAEAQESRPGNRGKRDSQLMVMNFLSRAILDDRMTAFDYDLFWKIEALTGHAPDAFEALLMVDADTRVEPNAVTKLVNALENDSSIMGLCGETRIGNKRASWVTLIQVFEYYISHHLGKGFESAFGGVTCLPGCFCMYRIKVRKGPERNWVPLLVNLDIVEEYSENVVDTLHKKNLLLLGEDRFLTTLMLRNFPKRKTVFVPQAVCHTVVPETFRVLLSQRRRWINSTVHNLLELMLVKDLCGIFCFSMQIVVVLELIGTIVLPAAVIFTVTLLLEYIIRGKPDWFTIAMFLGALGLPALLVLLATPRKVNYLFYMVFYILAIPVWNLVLPMYAYWHFDDFSWGETRKIEGRANIVLVEDNDDSSNSDDSNRVVLKRWPLWERERRRQASAGKPLGAFTAGVGVLEVQKYRKIPYAARSPQALPTELSSQPKHAASSSTVNATAANGSAATSSPPQHPMSSDPSGSAALISSPLEQPTALASLDKSNIFALGTTLITKTPRNRSLFARIALIPPSSPIPSEFHDPISNRSRNMSPLRALSVSLPLLRDPLVIHRNTPITVSRSSSLSSDNDFQSGSSHTILEVTPSSPLSLILENGFADESGPTLSTKKF
ncbi:chitin synthase [Synchytrium endobioticum]|uniref:chitin synthase n=1 Tax=Synchytrium endobioticum TaxID=286115 RepID=A0A507CB52_9FUNG|nr:chitin synthase [Synchytrium endobioticum]